jgi:hypothetical protein
MKSHTKYFLFAITYGAFFYVLQLFLFQRDMVHLLPTSDNLIFWDAGWYREIATEGYKLRDGQSSTAFYPLFPWIWKLSHLDAWGISVLNVAFFSCAFALFCKIYKISDNDKFIWVSIPALAFVFVPYTEALFMLSGMILVWGVYHKQRYVVWAGILLLSLCRPVSMILFPGLLIMEVISQERNKILNSIGSFFLNYGIVLILGFSLFVWIQYYQTGELFSFFKQQENWGHTMHLPGFPLDCITGPKTIWINAIALFIGFISLIKLVAIGVDWLKGRVSTLSPVLILSYLYLTANLFIILLFNPTWSGPHTTSVHDAYRYALASPFFWIFLYHYQYERKYVLKDYIVMFFLSNIFWFLFASYNHIMTFIYFNCCTAIIMLYMANADKKYTLPPLIIAVLNVYVQVWIFQFFISNLSPG